MTLVLGDHDILTVEELCELAEEEALALLGMTAEVAWAAIDRQDPKVRGTLAEVELSNLRRMIIANTKE